MPNIAVFFHGNGECAKRIAFLGTGFKWKSYSCSSLWAALAMLPFDCSIFQTHSLPSNFPAYMDAVGTSMKVCRYLMFEVHHFIVIGSYAVKIFKYLVFRPLLFPHFQPFCTHYGFLCLRACRNPSFHLGDASIACMNIAESRRSPWSVVNVVQLSIIAAVKSAVRFVVIPKQQASCTWVHENWVMFGDP